MSSLEENAWSRHQHLFKKNVRKTKRGLRILKIRVWELLKHGEGISTPHARHKGRQPLIECAKHDFKIVYFPFLYFFLFFWGRKGCCPCSYISSSAMRNSDLRSSLSPNVLCVKLVLCSFFFLKIHFNCEQKGHLRHWTLKQCFKF